MRRICLICEKDRTLTREHVLPLWLVRAIGGNRGFRHITSDGLIRTSANLDIVIRKVCAECNGGWLHDLEGAFRTVALPALNGQPVQLTQPEQRVMATWGIKTWMLAELALGHVRGGAPKSEGLLPYIRAQNQPPEVMKVWLGAVQPSRAFFHIRTTMAGSPRLGAIGVFVIGPVLFHIWAPEVATLGPQRLPALNVKSDGRIAPYLNQVWPHEVAEVRWPPPAILTIDQVFTLWPPSIQA